MRRAAERPARSTSLDDALGAALSSLSDLLDLHHAMLLMLDPRTQRLYTVASCGYATSGVGSEIAMGDGVIGVAARGRTPVCIGHQTSAYLYTQAMRSSLEADIPDLESVTDIPYPGLPGPRSQFAVPILCGGRLLGVLFAESPEDLKFTYEDEDAFVAIAGHLGATIELMQAAPESEAPVAPQPEAPGGTPLTVRHFAVNDSVFVNDQYLIKGVAGAILWKLLRDHPASGRTDFTNRELRLDPALGLPDVADSLEAALAAAPEAPCRARRRPADGKDGARTLPPRRARMTALSTPISTAAA